MPGPYVEGVTVTRLLVANRGEIAVRIVRAATEAGLPSVAIHSEDDADALHVRLADDARPLTGTGPAAYLDTGAILKAAADAGADAVHPGYGFLSEDAVFARRCAEAGLVFVGPQPEVLALFGDKAAGRALAVRCGVPVLAGTDGPTTPEEADAFVKSLQGRPVMVKAVAGGGGRGMRAVRDPADLAAAMERCRSEALQSFGSGDVYVEQLLDGARHIEVQIVGDGTGEVSHLGERECSLQRRHQKLVELAPAPNLDPALREHLLAAAVAMAREVRYANVGTFEFLVAPDGFAFLEANARLQVEHTVTEEVTGVDLVRIQLALAAGATLADLGLTQADVPPPRGAAVQARVNMETLSADGSVRPSGGTLTVFEPPAGPGIRVDTFGYTGYRTSPRFDSLLAKVVAWSGTTEDALRRAARAVGELRIEGVATNAGFLGALLRHPDVAAGRATTTFVEDHLAELAVDVPAEIRTAEAPAGTVAVGAPLQGTVVSVAGEGDVVPAGAPVAVLEAMKMEHVVEAATAGIVRHVAVAPGDTVTEGQLLLAVEPADVAAGTSTATHAIDLDHIRPDLAEAYERHRVGLDEARPDAVARRRKTNQRTARENVEDLVDPGSFLEYGPLALAAQRRRRTLDDLIAKTPADGLVGGIGTVNGARCAVMTYDYTVLAGTQGLQNHRKKDRLFELAERWRLPVVLFAEGGGGRPGDTDGTGVAGLDCLAFWLFGKLSGLVPLVGITSGRCFAGNAALLGCCDVIIATKGSNIGMGGPAMIEGGGLGVFRPEEIGPLDVQVANGVVDVAVDDEAEAVAVAKQYLSYFQGPAADWTCADQRLLRSAIPENRLRIYDVRAVLDLLADTGSVLELRRGFGHGMVTALARIEGRPVGVIANNPMHLAGAIDSDGADKAARFLQLCDAFGLPVLSLCDTPGIMVGPDSERTGAVRHASRMFVTGANLSVPFLTIVLRKGYGLGAQAMAAGSFKAPVFTLAWPTSEFGGMGLEGAVRLGYRNELAAVEDPEERTALYDELVARMYEHGKGISMASVFEIDDVIDPAESRRWIVAALDATAGAPEPASVKRRPFVDTW